MYDMYPDYSQNPEATAPLTHRASEAELRWWSARGYEEFDTSDYVDAHAVREAQQVLTAGQLLGTMSLRLVEAVEG